MSLVMLNEQAVSASRCSGEGSVEAVKLYHRLLRQIFACRGQRRALHRLDYGNMYAFHLPGKTP